MTITAFWLLKKLGLIHDLLVTRAARRKQIGLRLIGAARTWAKEHNLYRLMLETQTKNIPSVEFCQAAGFVFSGFNDRYFPNQDVALFFSLSLR
jgi:GNAT superfamily N-acetyltransferase